MSSTCVQQTTAYNSQDSLVHEGQNMRFINPNTLQQEGGNFDYIRQQQEQPERRFSYASMLSDTDAYLSNSSPSNNSDDFQQHHESSQVSPFIDPIYVDLHKQYQSSTSSPTLLMEQRPSYYDYPSYYHHQQQSRPFIHHPAGYPISSLCSTPTSSPATIKQHIRPMTPVSPPLLMKDSYYPQQEDNKKKAPRSRGRRVSNVPGCGARMFTCKADGCGKVFKRSEHLKRHIRSIHTLEKPFECPYQSCNKRFSRSDNLNQHIRIHRNSNNSTTHKESVKSISNTTNKLNMKQESLSTNNNTNVNHHHFNNTSTFSNFI